MSLGSLLCWALLGGVVDETYLAWGVQPAAAEAWPKSSAQRLSADELAALLGAEPALPFDAPTVAIRADNGALWVGSARGLQYLAAGAPRWQVFHSRRWLPDNQVQDLAQDAAGAVWVKTGQGTVRLAEQPTTLEAKMAEVEANLRRWHVRVGLVGEIDLKEPGRIDAGYFQPSSDNDGLWTSLYVAAEAFRFGTTGDEAARQNAWESLQALMFLERITGIPGFAARSVVPIDDDPQRYGGEWHRSADGKWWWKGDTSSDELDGHYLAYSVYYDLAATPEQKAEIRPYVERITDHLMEHGWYYVGPSGKPTTWGVFAPERLNHDLSWLVDRGLNSLELLSHLKVAHHLTGHARYAEAARELNEKHAYAINTVEQKILWPASAVNHSDDELAFSVYYPLLRYERDPYLRTIYRASLNRSWQIERPERSPLFNYIYAAGVQADRWTDPAKRPDQPLVDPQDYDADACLEYFRDVPIDTLNWRVENSGRRDLGPIMRNRFDEARALTVLPISQRRVMKWNGDPYSLDGGGSGNQRDDGTFILLPYWMGRYHRFLE